MKNNQVIIYHGSNSGFHHYLNENNYQPKTSFTSKITKMDKERLLPIKNKTKYNLIVCNYRDFFTITDKAVQGFVSIMQDILNPNGTLIVQNPSIHILEELKLLCPSVVEIYEEPVVLKDDNIVKFLNQNTYLNEWKINFIKTLSYASDLGAKKPYVILLYGKSGLGKTHIVREAGKLLDSELSSYQLSNYQEMSTISTLLGTTFPSKDIYSDIKLKPNSLILLDEFDKMHSFGYNAFYDLFDNEVAESDNVRTKMTGRIIICTTNYETIEAVEDHLPAPIVGRIDRFIHVHDLTEKDIEKYIESKNLPDEVKARLLLDIATCSVVNLRVIDKLLNDILIDDHWTSFMTRFQ